MVVWNGFAAAVNFLVEILGLVAGFVLNPVAFVVDLVFAIPVVGRLARQIFGICQTVTIRIIGLLDLILDAIGFTPEKRIRLRVIILHDDQGAIAEKAEILRLVQKTIDTLWEAHIRVIPDTLVNLVTPFHDKPTANDDYVHEVSGDVGKSITRSGGGTASYFEDMWITGATFQWFMSTRCFWGNFRRLLGYGAPITCFVLRDIDGALGVSLGPLTDYITMERLGKTGDATIAHEIGHACGLLHATATDNLMTGDRRDSKLTRGQAIWIRNSRHITYF